MAEATSKTSATASMQVSQGTAPSKDAKPDESEQTEREDDR